MKYVLSNLIFSLMLTWPVISFAKESTFRLTCSYSHSKDANGIISPVAEEVHLITVMHSSNGSAVIKKQGVNVEFLGVVKGGEVSGEVRYKKDGRLIHQTLLVNRYTGSFMNTHTIGFAKSVSRYGSCFPAQEGFY